MSILRDTGIFFLYSKTTNIGWFEVPQVRIAERGYPARWYPRCLGAKCPSEMPWLPGLPIESILPWHRLELGTASTPTNHITTRLWARHSMVNHADGPGIAHSANEIWNRKIAWLSIREKATTIQSGSLQISNRNNRNKIQF